MKYFLLALGAFLVYQLTRSWLQFREIKGNCFYELGKIQNLIKENPSNPILYCRRGSIYQNCQNFIDANLDFRKALEMVKNGAPVAKKEELINTIIMNLKYTEKPLPWSRRGPKDLSNSWLVYFLIERFGGKRNNF
jgi:hypothetical protein